MPSKETKKILFEETANSTISLIFRMAYPNTSIDNPWKKKLRNNLKDKTILLIGQGNIGKRVKQKLKNIISVITYDLKKPVDSFTSNVSTPFKNFPLKPREVAGVFQELSIILPSKYISKSYLRYTNKQFMSYQRT